MSAALTPADAEAIARMLLDRVLAGSAPAGVIDLDRDTAARAKAELVPDAWTRLVRDAQRAVEEYRDTMAGVDALRAEIGDLVAAAVCRDPRAERAQLMDSDAWGIYEDGWQAAVRRYRDALASAAGVPA